jgi:hypothetical protein
LISSVENYIEDCCYLGLILFDADKDKENTLIARQGEEIVRTFESIIALF